MDFEGALRARFIAAPPVAALVAQRVYWVDRPQDKPLPDITLTVISDTRDQHMKGFQELQFTRVQVDCRASTYAGAKALAEASIAEIAPASIENGINFRRATVNGPRDLGERTATAFIHRKQFDLIIPHSPA
jgi:hypothetical protein